MKRKILAVILGATCAISMACFAGCNLPEPETKPESGHTHSYTEKIVRPTCTEQGFTVHICECGNSYVDNYTDIDKIGHKFTEYVSNNDATCTQKGTKTALCGNGCGKTDTKIDLSSIGHGFNYISNNDATCEQDGTKSAICSKGCGAISTIVDVGSKGHSFTNYVSDNNATYEQDGTKTATCDNGCGHTDTLVDEGSKLDPLKTFIYAESGSGYELTGYNGLAENVIIPAEYEGKSVIGITETAFKGNEKIKKVTIPASVAKISDEAFKACSALIEVSFGENSALEELGNGIFNNCAKLTTIEIPAGITKMGNYVFSDCKALENINLPEGLVSLGHHSFYNCFKLYEVTIPAGLTTISDWSFTYCASLEIVTFAENSVLEIVGRNAFRGCESLLEMYFPAGVKELRYAGLYQCKSLIRVQFGNYEEGIPGQLESIGGWGISECDSLAEVYLPGTLKKIEKSAFSQDPSLSLFVFYGTKSDWDSVEKADGWNGTKPFEIYCLDGETT